jgi:hypothetical protein
MSRCENKKGLVRPDGIRNSVFEAYLEEEEICRKDRGEEKEGMQGRVKIKPELLDQALKQYRGRQDRDEIFKEVQESGSEACAGGWELSQHLGYGKGEEKP